MTEKDVTQMLHSRGVTMLMALLTVGGALLAFTREAPELIPGNRGIIFPSANLWIGVPEIEMWVNVGLTLVAAFGMLLLSRSFNLLRTVSQLDSTLFLAMSLATPGLLCQFFTGTPLLLTLIVCLFLLYSSYANPAATPRIFLIFALLSLGSMTQYCYAVYIPVFFIGLGQMRIFNLRSVSAALIGLITPWWIVLGTGIVGFDDIHAPEFENIFTTVAMGDTLHMLVAVLITAVLLICGWALNFMKMLSYNAHLRAYTGTLSMLALFTLLAIVVDFNNVYAYAPALYMLTAFQLCHLFVNRREGHTAAVIGGIIAIYLALYAAALFL